MNLPTTPLIHNLTYFRFILLRGVLAGERQRKNNLNNLLKYVAFLALTACSSQKFETVGSTRQALTCGNLVAAYSFDQTSGSVLNDISGNGNNGTITSASWSTTAKSGHSLNFNGTTATVSIPSSAALAFDTAMTVEAWVRPTSLGSTWRTVMLQEASPGLVWGLYANENIHESSPLPGFWTRTGTDQATPLDGLAALTTNSWQHLAASYDGSVMRLYLNGNQVSMRNQTGSLASSTSPLKLGSNSVFPGSEAFAGQIDTTCLWKSVRTAAQIQSDMATTDCGVSAGACSVGSGGSGGTGGGSGGSGGTSSGGTSSGGTSAGTGGTGGGGAGGTGGSGGSPISYSTNFDLTESVISEGGMWKALGLGLAGPNNPGASNVTTASGIAHGTSAAFSTSGTDDSYAILAGLGAFPPDQSATAVIALPGGWFGNWSEVALDLRMAETGSGPRGYECFISVYGQYATVARWNPARPNGYDVLKDFGSFSAPQDGDVYSAKIVGNIITVTLRGTTLGTVDVSAFDGNVYNDGNPGISFDADINDTGFGFTSYSATSL